MSLELLSEINARYQTAIAFHRESADLFWFLSLPGFAALHEYQYKDESCTQRKLKKFIIMNCQQAPIDPPPEEVRLLQPLVGDQKRIALKKGDTEMSPIHKWEAMKQAWSVYLTWETSTLKEYESIAEKLFEDGDIAEYQFIAELIKDVSEEIASVADIIAALRNMEFDMPTVTSMQPDMEKHYKAKLCKFYKHILEQECFYE